MQAMSACGLLLVHSDCGHARARQWRALKGLALSVLSCILLPTAVCGGSLSTVAPQTSLGQRLKAYRSSQLVLKGLK